MQSLNGKFQRISRRDKKGFLSEKCKDIQENNRMGKTRYIFKKITNIKGTFHARTGTIKDRNSKDLMTRITMMVWTLTQSKTSWSVKSSGP